MKKYFAEFIGTATLVLMGCGSATIANLGGLLGGGQPFAPLALVGISLAFGLSVVAMAYGIGPVSGCHSNPAVTVGVYASGRMPASEVPGYIISQVLGGIAGAALLYVILAGRAKGYDLSVGGLGQNGWGPKYLGEYSTGAAVIAEFVGTFIFLVVILGATSKEGATPVAGLAIGLTLVLIHIVFINVTGVSVNPARSLGPALLVGGTALSQVWLFLIVPIVAAFCAGLLFKGKALEN
jgi:aquaporin Z